MREHTILKTQRVENLEAMGQDLEWKQGWRFGFVPFLIQEPKANHLYP